MRVVPVVQGTAAWLQERVGRITSSRMVDLMAKRKRGTEEMACKRGYRMELICERLTGRAAEHYVSREMEHGIENEPFARSAYEVGTGVMVDEVGFVLHPNMDFGGASPDGLVGDDGCIEIKCPTTANFLEWRLAGTVPEEHQDQMMWVMACCERQWCDFVGFDPRLPQGLRFFVTRLARDEKRIAAMEYEVVHFHAEVEEACKRLGAYEWRPPTLVDQLKASLTERLGNQDVPLDVLEAIHADEDYRV